ncbi:hypothetical protein BO78DRAFT_370878 [Aspergillus sclerotiicarbonarius CBS 121057]|uniref:Zn(2)-C6 fungal-type domain-containing protein n=1 Tax=Aspergillus sclerotiicarbonarius (strain CBS 121057 / IBT 28362) TaxID=1448318 RepID=A0A319EV53_ASPSB|nr:hypothetical protein BO78DRAFT_370878 [Aspergillus sclerotiicarbonarius CBS 121057]
MEASPTISTKRMRKGTRSCTACRRRKVRCTFPLDESDVCSHCARRGSACIPQDASPELDFGNSVTRQRRQAGSRSCNQPLVQATPVRETPDGSARFRDALKHLRQKIAMSLDSRRGHVPTRGVTGTARGPDSVQSDCAPIMKLLDHELIGRVSESDGDVSRQISDQESRHDKHNSSLKPIEHAAALQGLCEALPSEPEIKDIFQNRSKWWDSWRESFGLSWGDEDDSSLESFAIRAFRTGHPALVGSLLLCFAFSTGDFARYLPPVEQWILNNDELAGGGYGLQCLMGLGLCFMSSSQPRRAWMAYRKANTLMQLAGIHRTHRKSKSLDTLFWQLFAADRWVSLLVGLPYSVPENLCDLYIPPPDDDSFVSFHYRHMSVLTGRVIDCLQSAKGPSLSTVMGVDEQIDEITAQLPAGYLDPTQIVLCQDAKEKHVRVFRLAHVHHLKAHLYMPLFLQRSRDNRQEYSRMACVRSARILLEAYLLLYESDPAMASTDNSIKQSGMSALTAAVIVFLNLLGYGRDAAIDPVSHSGTDKYDDGGLINRTTTALKGCSEGQPSSFAGQCHAALENLVSSSRTLDKGERRDIVVPYFGMVTIDRRDHALQGHPDPWLENPTESTSSTALNADSSIPALPALCEDIFLSYSGPWAAHDPNHGEPFADDFSTAFDWMTGTDYGYFQH